MDMPEDHAQPQSGLKFVPEITAGNLLTVAVALIAMVTWGLRLEGRVDSESKLRDEQHTEMLSRLDHAEQQRRDDLRDIKDSLARIESKLDQKQDKPR